MLSAVQQSRWSWTVSSCWPGRAIALERPGKVTGCSVDIICTPQQPALLPVLPRSGGSSQRHGHRRRGGAPRHRGAGPPSCQVREDHLMREALERRSILPVDGGQGHTVDHLALGPSRSDRGLLEEGGEEDQGVQVLPQRGRVVVDLAPVVAKRRVVIGPMVQEELLCPCAAPLSQGLVLQLQGEAQIRKRAWTGKLRVDGGLALLWNRFRSTGCFPCNSTGY
mmetsp:Transcript_118764/g.298698  ORF Transcript_118764/g.298698 Transcript_118764/m.298698 type:complete len:223 (-) Transcript_118764:961-1629(-)